MPRCAGSRWMAVGRAAFSLQTARLFGYVCLSVCTFSVLAQNTVSASCQNRAGLKDKVLRAPPERALLADVAAGTAGLGMCQQLPLVSAQIHIVMAVFSIYADGIHNGAVVV